MKQEDSYKVAQSKLETYIQANNLRHTPERYSLLRYVCALEQPFSVDSLVKVAEEEHISLGTIYNSVNLFVSAQILHCINRRDGRKWAQYELMTQRTMRMEMICTRCGRVSRIKDAAIEKLVRTRKYSNFNMQGYSLYIYGECKTCKRKPQKDR